MTKQHGNDKPTDQNLHKSLCRKKSHLLEHGITEISLPQIGCGLDELEWKKVLTDIIHIFEHRGICVKLFFRKWHSNPLNENLIIAEEYDKDEETNRRLFHMCTARMLAFEGLLNNLPPLITQIEVTHRTLNCHQKIDIFAQIVISSLAPAVWQSNSLRFLSVFNQKDAYFTSEINQSSKSVATMNNLFWPIAH